MSFFLSFQLVFLFFHLKTYIQLYTLFDNVVGMVWRKRNLLDATTWQWCGMLGLFCTRECAPILSTLDSKPCNSKNRLLRQASTFQFDWYQCLTSIAPIILQLCPHTLKETYLFNSAKVFARIEIRAVEVQRTINVQLNQMIREHPPAHNIYETKEPKSNMVSEWFAWNLRNFTLMDRPHLYVGHWGQHTLAHMHTCTMCAYVANSLETGLISSWVLTTSPYLEI
jgi:hypothetical protein